MRLDLRLRFTHAIHDLPASSQQSSLGDTIGWPELARLTTYYAPYHRQNDWTGLQIGVCTGPVASWPTLWPHLKHYG